MNLNSAWERGTTIAAQYREEAERARLIALAPRRSGHERLARGLRGLAQHMNRFAESLEPAQAGNGPAWRGARPPTATH